MTVHATGPPEAAAAPRPRLRSLLLPGPSERWQLLFGLAAAVVAVLVVGWMLRDVWFFSDGWTILLYRRMRTVEGWLGPHAGHLVLPAVVNIHFWYRLVGMDYWPWYQIPHLVAYAGLCLCLWRVLLRRGADPWIAHPLLLVLLFLGASSWQRPYTIGNPLIHISLLVAATYFYERPRPDRWDRTVVGVVMTLAVVSGGAGLAAYAGLAGVALLTGRWRAWWPALAAPLLAYGSWFLIFRGQSPVTTGSLQDILLRSPAAVLALLEHAVQQAFAVPAQYGPVLLGMLVVGLAVALARRRLTAFDAVFLLTAAAYIGLVLIARIATGLGGLGEIRYGYNLALFLLPATVPHIRLDTRGLKLAAAGVLAFLLVANFNLLQRQLGAYVRTTAASREIVAAAVNLVEAGEPYLEDAPISADQTASLQARHLPRLLRDGWNPPMPADEHTVARGRGELRMGHSVRNTAHGRRPENADEILQRCTDVTAGSELVAAVDGATTIALVERSDTSVQLRWDDDYGVGIKRIGLGRGTSYVELMQPETTATLTVSVVAGDRARVCGLDAESGA